MKPIQPLSLFVGGGVLVLDQGVKAVVERSIGVHEVIPVIDGVFNLTLTYNRGAAFGLFAAIPDGTREVILGLTTTIALVVVAWLLFHRAFQDRGCQLALFAVVGGALGNLFDRVTRIGVVDFLDFYLGEYHWPAFNVADSAIVIGVAVLVWRSGRESKEVGSLSAPPAGSS